MTTVIESDQALDPIRKAALDLAIQHGAARQAADRTTITSADIVDAAAEFERYLRAGRGA